MKVVVVGPADAAAVAADCAPGLVGRLRDVDGYPARPTELLVRSLLSAGVEVELVTLSPSLTSSLTMTDGPLTVLVGAYRPAHRARDIFRAERRELASLLAQTDGSIVHAQWTYEFAWAALNDGRPLVVTAHDAPLTVLRHMPTPYRAIRAGMAYRVRAGSFHGVAVSPYLAAKWRRQMLDGRRLDVIPNLVLGRGPVRAPAERAGGCRLACVGDTGRRKNIKPLLHAFQLLRRRHPAATLSVVGPGLAPDDPFAQQAVQRGLSAGVRWLGRLDHESTLDTLAASDVAVHPSLEESFGMAVAESMAMGLPVVGGRRSGAVPWLLDGGRAGVLVDVRSPESLLGGLLGVIEDPAYADRVGDAAAERIRTSFSTDMVVDRHLRLYQQVSAPGAPPVPRSDSIGGRR